MARKARNTDAKYAVASARTTQEWFEWFMRWKTPALMKKDMKNMVEQLEMYGAYPDVFDSIALSFPRAYIIRLEEYNSKLEHKNNTQKQEIDSLHKLTQHDCIKAVLDFVNEKCKVDRVYSQVKLIEKSVKHKRTNKTVSLRKQELQNRTIGKVKPKGFRLIGKIPDDIVRRANGTFNKFKNQEIQPRISKKHGYLCLNVGRDWRLLNRGAGYELMSHERYNSLILL